MANGAAAPRLLQLGAKLIPLPQQLGNSFLLAISPRVMQTIGSYY